MVASLFPVLMSHTVTSASFSFDTYSGLPEGRSANSSGSGVGRVRATWNVVVSKIWISSSSPSQTSTYLPSGVTRMPRGRWPVGTVLITLPASMSITDMVLSRSFEVYAM